MQALAGAGGLTVAGVSASCSHDKDLCPHRYAIVHELIEVDPDNATPIVQSPLELDLMDADESRIVGRLENKTLVVYDAAGEIQRVLRPGGRITAALLDGSTIVVLRGRLLELYGLWSGRLLKRIRIGGFDQVVLRDAGNGLAVYTVGAVIHAFRFADGRDAALWIPRLALPPRVLIVPSGLVVGAQLEGRGAIVGLISQSELAAELARR